MLYGPSSPLNPQIVRYFEDQMLAKHRDELLAAGLVRSTGRGYVRV